MFFRRLIVFSLLTFFFLPLKISAQTLNPVKWEFSYKEIDDKNGEIILKAKLDPDWHFYSQLQSGDGPLPTVFTFIKTPDYDLNGKVIEPDPERKHDLTFDTDVAMFSLEAIFVQKIKRNNQKEFIIMGEVECMCCNNTMCLPPRTYKFSLKIPQNELK
ncbi:MAG TPA: protein-disulfide reductase DsbD domain-containing protein [Bacteroidia bacterium]|jgi:hypothetical protein|nr:protein-disulfide reductase DsbD domain-containing protein [Bacteroidia bacterium]